MTCCNFPLPEVLLSVSGDVFEARSPDGFSPLWHIRAEAETETAARVRVSLDARYIADVTVHATHESQLPDEVQAISAALLWSALRATAEPWHGIPPASSPAHDPLTCPCCQTYLAALADARGTLDAIWEVVNPKSRIRLIVAIEEARKCIETWRNCGEHPTRLGPGPRPGRGARLRRVRGDGMSDYPDTLNAFGHQGLVDAILRLLEQEEISRARARELMHDVVILYARGICCPNCVPAAPDKPLVAPWAKLDWCDDAPPQT